MTRISPKIDAARLEDRLQTLSTFGAHADGGIDRPAWSAAYAAAEEWLADQMRSEGLDVRRDGAGNLIGRLGGAGSALMIGSHIDTVPGGGRFDGALGVLGGLEVAAALTRYDLVGPPIEIVAFADEEGAALDLFGSRAMAGQVTAEEIETAHDRQGVPLTEHLACHGTDAAGVLSAHRSPGDILAYLELHVEQGTGLEDAGIDIGLVTAIPGIARCDFVFRGAQAHAGAAAMETRKDALRGAAAFVHTCFERLTPVLGDARMTFGALNLSPNVLNVVPEIVELRQEIRAVTSRQCSALRTESISIARECAAQIGLELRVVPRNDDAHAEMDHLWTERLKDAAASHGYTSCETVSWASHDCQIMAQNWPSALVFVPSVGGISHHPDEYTTAQDCAQGAQTLLSAVFAGMQQQHS